MKNILSVDGGGMRGYLACRMLADLEGLCGKPCREIFQLMAGTSIGGIIVLLLARGMPARDVLRFFTFDGPMIFRPTWWRAFGLLAPRYPSWPIEQALMRHLNEGCRMLRLSDLPVHVLIPSLDIARGNPVFFQNMFPGFDNVELWKIGRATSAAQTYFPAFEHGASVLWDGGNVANNPSACAMADARRLWGDGRLRLLSIGCGSSRPKFDARKVGAGGAMRVLFPTIEMLFESGSEDADYQCAQELGADHLRLEPRTNGDLPLDGASPSNLARLAGCGSRFADWAAPRAASFLSAS